MQDTSFANNLIKTLGFLPKENAAGVFVKMYSDRYFIEIDMGNGAINYGNGIKSDSKTTRNFSQPENFVVLECVDRLLEKGYKPENIILERTWKLGRANKGRLDILVNNENGGAYLMIECKTYGKEFDDELKNIRKDGGQLFSYFQQDKNADFLMLYASKSEGHKIINNTAVVKIDDVIRNAESVKDAHKRWNGVFQQEDFWEDEPYNIQSKTFTKRQLKELTEDEGKKLFHGFATILRKHSVSDKPNAFNVIFNLFLAKLYDEQKRDDDELDFQWKKNDEPVDFQVRLHNLHKEGLSAFLKKEIEGIDVNIFGLADTEKKQKLAKKKILKLNKLFDLKNVLDDDDFDQNQRVLKEVVQLIEKYQIRYPRKQKYLSEFFELLLTTGLKQEVGQYFTPLTIARFTVKSLPLTAMVKHTINQPVPSLPAAIDYAAGSGHFLTEILEEYQDIIESLDCSGFYPKAQKEVAAWKADQYNWAATYVYGIEKDYRLVKVAKVGCYFYGDGLAQVILGDGLDSFEKSKSYVGLLKENAKKPQFSIVVSNPPYSVDDCKDNLEYIDAQDEFELYNYLTDNSDDIECLFVERTKHLLKDGGVAGIVLPSSILSSEGIHAKAREIILQYFDIVAIAELGGNTFMATNTNTVVMFLRKRNEKNVAEIKNTAYDIAENYPKTHEDLTVNGIEKPVKKYLDYTEETEIDPEKFYYFVLNYHQKTVIVKTGEKEDEKRFLGYKIIKRRGNEGYHPIAGNTIDECTKLYNEKDCEDETKASAYIYKAFGGDYDFPIHESLKENVSRVRLVDMLTFDRANFAKNISTSVKKKVKIESKWDSVDLGKVVQIVRGVTYSKNDQALNQTDKIILTADNITLDGNLEIKKQVYLNNGFEIPEEKKLKANDIFICFSSGSKEHLGKVAFVETDTDYYAGGFMAIMRAYDNHNPKYIYLLLNTLLRQTVRDAGSGSNINNLSSVINNVKIPLPPKDVQKKIVAGIEVLEKKEVEAKGKLKQLNEDIEQKILSINKDWQDVSVENALTEVQGAITKIEKFNIKPMGKYPVVTQEKEKIINGYSDEENPVTDLPIVLFGDHSCSLKYIDFVFFRGADGTVLLKPKNNFVPKYFYYALNFIGLPKINNQERYERHYKYLKSIKIPLPPLSEQQKIVAKIEKIEAQITELERQLKEVPALKSAVLKKYL